MATELKGKQWNRKLYHNDQEIDSMSTALQIVLENALLLDETNS